MVFNGVKSHTKPIRGFNRWRVGPESQTWAIVRYKQKNERRCTDSELDCKWEGGKVQFVRGVFDFNFYLPLMGIGEFRSHDEMQIWYYEYH
jgi:hypothetical protein